MFSKNTLFQLLILVLIFSSCSVTSSLKTSQSKLNRQAEANVNSSKLVNKPLVADLTVSTERKQLIYKTTNVDMANSLIMVAGQSSKKKGNTLFSASESMKQEALNRAQFQFMMDFKCDYLIDPIYKVETESQSGSKIISITVDLSAYPANYKSFSQPDSLPKSIIGESKTTMSPLSRSFFGQTLAIPSIKSKVVDKGKSDSNNKLSKKPASAWGFILGSGQSIFLSDPVASYLNDYPTETETDPAWGLFFGAQYNAVLSRRLGVLTGINLRAVSWKSEQPFQNDLGNNYVIGDRKTTGNLFNMELPVTLRIKFLKRFAFYGGLAVDYIVANRYSLEETGSEYDSWGNVLQYNNEDSGSLQFEKKIQTGRVMGLEYLSENGFFVGYRSQSMGGDLEWSGSFFYLGKNF